MAETQSPASVKSHEILLYRAAKENEAQISSASSIIMLAPSLTSPALQKQS